MSEDTIAGRIKARRDALGITQQELALRSGIAQGVISRVESGQFTPGSEMLKQFARGLAISSDWLLGLREPSAITRARRNERYGL